MKLNAPPCTVTHHRTLQITWLPNSERQTERKGDEEKEADGLDHCVNSKNKNPSA